MFIDEVQDFAGHDFNFLLSLCSAHIDVLLVGDFYQHTFDTSRDGSVNKGLHDNLLKYESRFTDAGIKIDKMSLKNSRRCSKNVCHFINNNLHININSHDDRHTEVLLISTLVEANALHADQAIVKLFYQSHYTYNCHSQNWGASKGLDHFNDVCVVMNKNSWNHLRKGTLNELAAMTRNKLYVACSRARGNLYLVPDNLLISHRTRNA